MDVQLKALPLLLPLPLHAGTEGRVPTWAASWRGYWGLHYQPLLLTLPVDYHSNGCTVTNSWKIHNTTKNKWFMCMDKMVEEKCKWLDAIICKWEQRESECQALLVVLGLWAPGLCRVLQARTCLGGALSPFQKCPVGALGLERMEPRAAGGLAMPLEACFPWSLARNPLGTDTPGKLQKGAQG